MRVLPAVFVLVASFAAQARAQTVSVVIPKFGDLWLLNSDAPEQCSEADTQTVCIVEGEWHARDPSGDESFLVTYLPQFQSHGWRELDECCRVKGYRLMGRKIGERPAECIEIIQSLYLDHSSKDTPQRGVLSFDAEPDDMECDTLYKDAEFERRRSKSIKF